MSEEKLNLKQLLQKLPPRAKAAHKGNFGHVLIIGGDFGYPGAPILAAMGALRVGAGLVTVASHTQNLIGINSSHPEIMCHAIDDPNSLQQILTKVSVVVLGIGLGRTVWSQAVYNIAIQTHLPILVDADGLFFLAQNPTSNPNRILTPHPGEAITLLHANSINPDRIQTLEQLIRKYDCTVVLKGAGTLVASPEHAIGICEAGNPGMTSGGMGDLLSGVIAGLVAQGLDLDTAAKLGVCVHAKAGDLAALDGQRGIIATDLLLPIKHIVQN